MKWTAIVPLKGRGERKTRLASRLNKEQRRQLSHQLFEHVVEVLRASPDVARLVLLSDVCPADWQGAFFLDEGRGLNAELDELAKAIPRQPLLVIHADLPLLAVEDIEVLLAEAERGFAIAPDRAGSGTNAVALGDPSGFQFGFGPNSLTRHLEAAGDRACVIGRPGLGLDIDTPEDFDTAISLGFLPRFEFS